jgi:hypothetical protein
VSILERPAGRVLPRLPGGRRLRDGHYIYWWLEIVAIVAFYLVYSAIRNANEGSTAEAFTHAKELIRIQEFLGINHEQILQQWALDYFKPFVILCNYFYGSMHFIVTAGVGIYLFRKWSNDWPLWRNTLAITTGLALVGFILWPLMPPRLLPASYGFEDTLAQYPTFWSFNSGAVSKISNQYAAMPSVHCAWALWCTVVMVPRLKRNWAKVAFIAYPFATVAAIVFTGNHYVLDAVGGFAVLGIGYLLARPLTRAGQGPPVPEAS